MPKVAPKKAPAKRAKKAETAVVETPKKRDEKTKAKVVKQLGKLKVTELKKLLELSTGLGSGKTPRATKSA